MRPAKCLAPAVLVAACFILGGCQSEYVPKRLPFMSGRIELSPSPYEEPVSVNGAKYREEHAVYIFGESVPEKTRDEVMDIGEEILGRFGYSDISFYTLDDCVSGYADANLIFRPNQPYYFEIFENEMFLNSEDISPVYIALACNQKKYGASVNYGLLYAISYAQCSNWGYELPELPSDAELAERISARPEISELNPLVFRSVFSSPEEKRAGEGLAVKMLESRSLEELEKIAASENSDGVAAMMSDDACLKLGAKRYVGDGISEYVFYNTGYYIVAETGNFRFFIANDLKDFSGLVENLTDIYRFLTLMPKNICAAAEYIGVDESDFSQMQIVINHRIFENIPGYENVGGLTYYYFCQNNSVYTVFHECMHLLNLFAAEEEYLKGSSTVNGWIAEAFPTYLGAVFDEYYSKAFFPFFYTGHGRYTDETAEHIKRLVEKFPPHDVLSYVDICAYAVECADSDAFVDWAFDGNKKLLFETAVSFCGYLIDEYGLESLLELFFSSTLTETDVYGKDFNTLRREWFTSLQAKYAPD